MELSYYSHNYLYPKMIMGCDTFLRRPFSSNYSGREIQIIQEYMKCAYEHGILGIDVNIASEHVYNAFVSFKEQNPMVIGIGDPNMGAGFFLKDKPLKVYTKEISKTIYEYCLNNTEKSIIMQRPLSYRQYFFPHESSSRVLLNEEIDQIWLDVHAWEDRLSKLSKVCKFCLFGADYADWLLALERTDIIKFQYESILKYEMIPISVFHWTSKSLPKIWEVCDVDMHWIFSNKDFLSIVPDESLSILKCANNITGFRLFRNSDGFNDVSDALHWATDDIGANSIVIGAPNTLQEAQSFFKLVSDEYKKTCER